MPDTRESAESLLIDVEQQLDSGRRRPAWRTEPAGCRPPAATLRSVALAFAGVLEAALSAEAFDHAFRRRVEAVAQRLATQREAWRAATWWSSARWLRSCGATSADLRHARARAQRSARTETLQSKRCLSACRAGADSYPIHSKCLDRRGPSCAPRKDDDMPGLT